MLSTNTWLRIIASMQINAILFGLGVVVVLVTPALAANAKYWIPAVVAVSFIVAPLLAGFIARRMRIQEWGRDKWTRGDAISG